MGIMERVFGDRMSFLTSTRSNWGRDAGIWQSLQRNLNFASVPSRCEKIWKQPIENWWLQSFEGWSKGLKKHYCYLQMKTSFHFHLSFLNPTWSDLHVVKKFYSVSFQGTPHRQASKRPHVRLKTETGNPFQYILYTWTETSCVKMRNNNLNTTPERSVT